MTQLSERELATMAELSVWDFDWTPAGFERVARPDRLLWSWDEPWPWASGVGWVRWDDSGAEGGIGEALDFFGARQRDFGWYAGPSTTLASLPDRLGRRGFTCQTPRLMTAELAVVGLRMAPGVEVREIDDEATMRQAVRIQFPRWTAQRVDRAVTERLAYLAFSGRRGGHLVAVVGGEVIAYAAWRDSGDGRCVQLVGGATAPKHRRRGAYSTLTAYRLERALQRGRRFAAIVADPTTSGAILQSRGFRDHGPLFICRREP